jgi:hypothetical protein
MGHDLSTRKYFANNLQSDGLNSPLMMVVIVYMHFKAKEVLKHTICSFCGPNASMSENEHAYISGM